MAGRTSASTGTIVTIAVLIFLTLSAFVAFAIFFGKYNDAKAALAKNEQDNREIIGSERNRDDIRALIAAAGQSQEKSLVNYLAAERSRLLTRITGDARDNLTSVDSKLQGVEGADGSLVSMISAREQQIAANKAEIAQLTAARDQALADLKNETSRIAIMTDQHKKTLEQINNDVAASRTMDDDMRAKYENLQKELSAQVERAKTERDEIENRYAQQVRDLTERNLILESNVANLRGQRSKDLFKGADEASLADGTLVSVNEVDNTVVVSLGRKDRIPLGMTFTVYGSANAIRPNEAGDYPPGKATLEVINVAENTATARITSELKGNPVIRGDVIANAVYDPSKTYKFVVFGNFDSDRDGIPTPAERAGIEAMVKNWGGATTDDLSGDVDFLLLGARPLLPPRPDGNAPLEVALEFQRRFRDVERYDALSRQAVATGVPVLNENRLYTLIGRTPAPLARR
ncbi:MAG: hypothetical protein U0640_04135 [Phycisphaerales bacterium]